MTRLLAFGSPYLLGFDHFERLAERLAKAGQDGYPPYNIEQTGEGQYRLSLAVAGFAPGELTVTVEEHQLVIRGKQADDATRVFLHRGIAARQFQRSFVLADFMEPGEAELAHGMLSITLTRKNPDAAKRTIPIRTKS